jgi:hypothetical protein
MPRGRGTSLIFGPAARLTMRERGVPLMALKARPGGFINVVVHPDA